MKEFVINQTKTIKLSIESFLRLRDFIYEKSGIFFPENKLYLLENRLNRRVRELDIGSFEEYISYLKRLPSQTEELSNIYNQITINETYFCRYEKQLEIFGNKLIQEVIERRTAEGKKQFTIWSSASSSGEELYTIAMILKEKLGRKLDEMKFDLIGTDISARILENARKGIYTNNSFRSNMNAYYKTKYFDQNGTKYHIKDEIKRMARFEFLNLNDVSAVRRMRGVDFLFCRNVLIYFDLPIKKKVVRSFYDVLNHGGYLFLGEAESLHGISSAFKVVHFPGVFVYWKE